MLQNYHMDLKEEIWHPRTPAPQEKNLPVYLLDWGHFCAGERYYTQRRGGRFYLFMYTLSGRGFLDYQGKRYDLSEGKAAFIDCEQNQLYGSCSQAWEFIWFQFDGVCGAEYYRRVTAAGEEPVWIPGQQEFLLSLMRDMEPLSRNQDARSGLELSTLLVRVLSQLAIDRLDMPDLPVNSSRVLEQVLDYMRAFRGESLSLDELASRAYLSKYHFLRVFKAYTGMTPHAYLVHIKLNRAKKLLKTTGLSIGEIAVHTGFHDAKAFASAFKKATGMTAGQYRNF